ncbi:hypothetical protein RCL1_001553 [Eukaryota sp. TZLM3-RCL]
MKRISLHFLSSDVMLKILNLTAAESTSLVGMVTHISTKTTKNGKNFTTFLLNDETGAIRATMWGDHPDLADLSARNVIRLDNCKVNSRNITAFADRSSSSDFEVILSERTTISHLAPNALNLPSPRFSSLADLKHFIGVVIRTTAVLGVKYKPEQMDTKRGPALKQSVKLVDSSTCVSVSFWGSVISTLEGIPQNSVIDLIGVIPMEYNGNITLQAGGQTAIEYPSRSQEGRQLTHELRNGLVDTSLSITRASKPNPEGVSFTSLREFLDINTNENEKIYRRVCAFIASTNLAENCVYSVCSGCNCSLRNESSCQLCDSTETNVKFLVKISLLDTTAGIEAVLFSDNAAEILQVDATQFQRLNLIEKNSKEKQFLWKLFTVLLSKKQRLGRLSIECLHLEAAKQTEVALFGDPNSMSKNLLLNQTLLHHAREKQQAAPVISRNHFYSLPGQIASKSMDNSNQLIPTESPSKPPQLLPRINPNQLFPTPKSNVFAESPKAGTKISMLKSQQTPIRTPYNRTFATK